ncbi:MAG: hypothetical protein K2J79_08905 [Ruminiclostridium sp.]|nr:hypothetical protein [Ruminiclostridium sp.]
MCAGQTPLRAPDGKHLFTVPVYKIVSAEDADPNSAVELASNERLVLVGITESKKSAEERYNALVTSRPVPESHAVPLYIKDTFDGVKTDTELTEGKKRTLNPLIADLLHKFSAAMQEREALKWKPF